MRKPINNTDLITEKSKIIYFFLPDDLSSAEAGKAQSIIFSTLIYLIGGVVFAPVYFLLGHFSGGVIISAGASTALINLVYFKYSAKIKFARYMPSIIYFTVMVGLALTQGGIHDTALAWFIITPLVALYTISLFASIVWAVITALMIFFLYFLNLHGISLPNPLSEESMTLLLAMGTVGVTFYALLFGIVNEHLKNTAYSMIFRMANEDMLTGIHNRRHFFELAQDLFENEIDLFAVIMDLDKFKNINDCYGHPVGDAVLKEFTKCIKSQLHENEVFGRLGGEEFVIIIPEKNEERVKLYIEKLRASVQKLSVPAGESIVQFTVSSGIANKNSDIKDLDSLLKKADDALYEAKGSGRNKIIFRV